MTMQPGSVTPQGNGMSRPRAELPGQKDGFHDGCIRVGLAEIGIESAINSGGAASTLKEGKERAADAERHLYRTFRDRNMQD